MAIDRPLSTPFPVNQEMGEVEIEIENPESVSVETPDGGVIIDFNPDMTDDLDSSHDANLAEVLDPRDLAGLASDLVTSYKNDKESRADWERSYIDGLELLGLKMEERTTPWDGACGVSHPLLTEAVIRFPFRWPCKNNNRWRYQRRKRKTGSQSKRLPKLLSHRKDDRV